MRLARWVFLLAGLYGLAVMVPQFFMEAQVGRDNPPEITHPEYFYGFVGVGVAWQIAFLIIARDPARFRPLMIPGMLEKIAFGVAALILRYQGRTPFIIGVFAVIDLLLAALFMVAFDRVGDEANAGLLR
jgi:hypothetical protein